MKNNNNKTKGVLFKKNEDLLRQRYPRAFPNNSITSFDFSASRFQNIIQQNGSNEKIRLTIKGETTIYITDLFIYFISNKIAHTASFLNMSDISSTNLDGNIVNILTKNNNSYILIANDDIEAQKIQLFINSQKIMTQTYFLIYIKNNLIQKRRRF